MTVETARWRYDLANSPGETKPPDSGRITYKERGPPLFGTVHRAYPAGESRRSQVVFLTGQEFNLTIPTL